MHPVTTNHSATGLRLWRKIFYSCLFWSGLGCIPACDAPTKLKTPPSTAMEAGSAKGAGSAARSVPAADVRTLPEAAVVDTGEAVPLTTAANPEDGLPVVAWSEARQVVGTVARVYGKITQVGHTPKISFLNFSRDRSAFSAVIFSPNEEKFGGTLEGLFRGKLVMIRGPVTLFKDSPQIVISDPHQIEVVDALPETFLPKSPARVPDEELVVGSFNVENLFDDIDDPYRNDDTTPAKPRGELEAVARVIREIDADVLALQEVESRGFLQQFLDSMLPDMGYRHVVHYEGNDQRGIDVCLISRVHIGRVTSHRHVEFPGTDGDNQSFRRDLLCVEVLPIDGDPFEVWIVHLKSNSGGREAAEPIRLGEARALHQIIAARLELDPQAAFLLCGDFNDTFESPTLQTILGQPAALQSIFGNLTSDHWVTYNREPFRNMIDFIFCSPAMLRRYVDNSFAIRLGNDAESGSDHNPIAARFRKSSAHRRSSSAH